MPRDCAVSKQSNSGLEKVSTSAHNYENSAKVSRHPQSNKSAVLFTAGLDHGTVVMGLDFRDAGVSNEPTWHGYTTEYLYNRLMNLPDKNMNHSFAFFSAVAQYGSTIKQTLRYVLFGGAKGNSKRVRNHAAMYWVEYASRTIGPEVQ